VSSVPDEDDALFSNSRFLQNFHSMFMFYFIFVLFCGWEHYAKDEFTNMVGI
jgi:hypothetical protein